MVRRKRKSVLGSFCSLIPFPCGENRAALRQKQSLKETKMNAKQGDLLTNAFLFNFQIFVRFLVCSISLFNLSMESTSTSCCCTNGQMFMYCCFCLGLQLIFAFELIEYDFQKDEPVRNEQGWCHRVRKGKRNYEDVVLSKEPESNVTGAEFREKRTVRNVIYLEW